MTVAPFGSWKSPITSELIVAGTVRLGDIALDGGDIYWQESRPTDAGRYTIVRMTPDGATTDVNPAPYNARTRVHEYGGGAYDVVDGVVFFTNYADQRLYRQRPGEEPRPLTPDIDLRYADFRPDRARGRMIGIREDHRESDQDAVNAVVAVDMNGASLDDGGTVLVGGNDFYSNPRLSLDGARLCWLTWNHPNMPWDGTELWVGEIGADGAVASSRLVAGGLTESVFQPEWAPDGTLTFISDRSGWWNLYQERDGAIVPLHPMEAEFGVPGWVFGQSTYDFDGPDRIICAFTKDGLWSIGDLRLPEGDLIVVPTPFTDVAGIRVRDGVAVFMAGSATMPTTVFRHDLATGDTRPLRASSNVTVDPGYVSVPRPIEFPTEHGLTAHGFYYAPTNKEYTGPAGELPPLVVLSHGGPTGSTDTTLDLQLQYWTSRGFAVLDVNYGGSTGYGRAYRERLNDTWGITDVDDCVNGARYLVEQGLVDGDRLTIRGWSASGYTTLAALAFRDVFKAGASHFGISDLEAMARDTHKFESRYLDRLIGEYPKDTAIYEERSPIHFVDNISCPLILFQGLEDKVVPPNQAQMMYDAVDAKGLPVALVMFEGEQHGFRQAANIRRSLDGELYFLSRVFGFEPAEAIEPVPIANL
ncbi:MAG: S9 family peptidase [Thermomicrobiales bacterium]|nr:S9 family peptidase [Thermomicrobiales bacterium]